MKARSTLLRAIVVAVACAASTTPGAAMAFVCITGNCQGWCEAVVPYSLATTSADLGDARTEAEVQRSMNAWAETSCTSLRTEYRGRTTTAPSGGNAVIGWVESGWTQGSGVIGSTLTGIARNCITSSMRLNGVNFTWVVGAPTRTGQVDTFSIVAHEGGHYFGLNHSTAAGAIMQAQYRGGALQLSQDDVDGICRIYPASRAAAAGAAGATGGMAGAVAGSGGEGGARAGAGGSAAGATAERAGAGGKGGTSGAGGNGIAGQSGTVADGRPCDDGTDCASGLCVETRAGVFCSRFCEHDADCAAGSTCTSRGDRRLCEPAVHETPQSGTSDGEPADDAVRGGCSFGGRTSHGSSTFAAIVLVIGALAARRRRMRVSAALATTLMVTALAASGGCSDDANGSRGGAAGRDGTSALPDDGYVIRGGAGGRGPSAGPLCAPCTVRADCAGDRVECLRNDETGERFCGRDCADAPCPAGFVCRDIKNATFPRQCVANTATCGGAGAAAGASGAAGQMAEGGQTGAAGAGGTGTGDPSYLGPFCEGNPRHVIGVVTRPADANASIDEIRKYLLDTTNVVRAFTNLPPLVYDDCLTKIGEAAMDDLANGGSVHGYFLANCMNQAHGFGKSCECNWSQENYGSAGGSSWTWKDAVNVPMCGMMDEPKGQGHRGNIESKEWKRMGVGVRKMGSSLQRVQEFGR